MYNKHRYLKANDKKVLHKVKKQWVTISLALLMVIGGGAIATHVASANNITTTTSINKPVNIKSPVPSIDPNNKFDEEHPDLTDGPLKQNYHYNNPSGVSNDLQSIVPHYTNGHIDYWNGYYLWGLTTSTWYDQWYKYKTPDFSHIGPANSSDPASVKNVAVPNKEISVDGQPHVEVQKNNTDPIPWNYAASGSVIPNNSKFGGQSWLSHDEWGNPISPNATLAYFATFGADTSANGCYLAYSNNGQQFHPYSTNDVFDATTAGGPAGSDFRDPYMTTCDNGHKMLAYLAGGTHKMIYVITSTDGVHWQHQANLDINTAKIPEFSNNATETPYISELNGTPIMFFSSQMYPQRNHEMVGYVVGHFTKDGVFQPNNNAKTGLIDQGFDNYAGNFTPIDNNHLVYIGWYGNWEYFNVNHIGGFTLPKVLNWNGKYIEATPIEPGSKANVSINNLAANLPVQYQSNGKVSLNFQKPLSNFNIHLNRGNNMAIDFSFDNGTMTINRTDDFNNAMNMSKSVQLPTTDLSNVQLYLDNASVGVYLPEIHQVLSNLSYDNTANEPYTLRVNQPTQATSYNFNLAQDPNLDNINNITSEYSADKAEFNHDMATLNGHDSNLTTTQKSLLTNYFNVIQNAINDANTNISQVNNYKANNDARQHVFIALANNDMDIANTKLYQANYQLKDLNDTTYAYSGASAADAKILNHYKNSVANSVAQANQKIAQNAAQISDQKIAQQQRTSVADSVAAANRARANHAAQIADQNILNQQKQSVANSVNAANQRTATSAANSADKNIESSIANSYAKSADNSIVASYKNSASASVSAANNSYAKTTAGKADAKSGASSADKNIESSIASSYAKSADNSIANSYKNSVNTSVEVANQSKANSAAKSANTSIANSAAKSVNNSIESSIANSYANSANNSIASSYRNSVSASVSSVNQSKANSAKASADQSIENSEEAKDAQNMTPVTPINPAPVMPTFNSVVTPSSEASVSNSSVASSEVMPTSESTSEISISHKATKPVTHHSNTHKIALNGVNKRAYFTSKHYEAKFTTKMRKHATVLEATVKSNHSVAYKVRVGKHVGYIYGYLTKLAKPSFFMYKNHAYIHFGKKAIRVYTKNFKFIRINKSIQLNNHNYIKYYVNYGKKHGVMYGKLPVIKRTKKVANSKYYQLMPKHYHYAKVIKPLCIYSSKYFSKRTRRGVISKDITVKIKRVVKADKTTRFELRNGKYITGLKNFTKLV